MKKITILLISSSMVLGLGACTSRNSPGNRTAGQGSDLRDTSNTTSTPDSLQNATSTDDTSVRNTQNTTGNSLNQPGNVGNESTVNGNKADDKLNRKKEASGSQTTGSSGSAGTTGSGSGTSTTGSGAGGL